MLYPTPPQESPVTVIPDFTSRRPQIFECLRQYAMGQISLETCAANTTGCGAWTDPFLSEFTRYVDIINTIIYSCARTKMGLVDMLTEVHECSDLADDFPKDEVISDLLTCLSTGGTYESYMQSLNVN